MPPAPSTASTRYFPASIAPIGTLDGVRTSGKGYRMGPHSVRSRVDHRARALALHLSAFALVGACNALLGTPEPELAEEAGADAGGDTATSQAEATTGQDADATTGQDADATTAQDSTAQDSTAQDSTAQELDGAGLDGARLDGAGLGGARCRCRWHHTGGRSAEPDATPDEASAEGGAPPSCSDDGGPGFTTWGPTGDCCCNSFLVPGGTYSRVFSTGADGAATSLQSPATVSSFRLDEYEVTVGRFRQFVLATRAGWMPLPGSGKHTHVNGGQGLQQTVAGTAVYESGWVAGWANNMSQPDGGGTGFMGRRAGLLHGLDLDAPAGQPGEPADQLRHLVRDLCVLHLGRRLPPPASAEWEYAAAGGSQEREYPWGRDRSRRRQSVRGLRLRVPRWRRHPRRRRDLQLPCRTSRRWGPRRWVSAGGRSSIWVATSTSSSSTTTTSTTSRRLHRLCAALGGVVARVVRRQLARRQGVPPRHLPRILPRDPA